MQHLIPFNTYLLALTQCGIALNNGCLLSEDTALTVTETLISDAMTCDGDHPCPSGPSLDFCACCSCVSDCPSGPHFLCVYHGALNSPSSALQTETPPLR